MLRNLLIAGAMALALSACVSTGAYVDNEHYYTVDGVSWSCRNAGEPGKDNTVKPGGAYRGGNCRPESEWTR